MSKDKLQTKRKGVTLEIRKGQDPNVPVYTDLPPDVHGQLRCYLMFIMDNFTWTGKKTKKGLKIVAKWWGEQSQGTTFFSDKLPGIAKYAIKCGPRQFSSYLNDTKQLTLEFIDSTTYQIQGEAKIDVMKLSKNNLIKNYAPITAPMSNRVIGKIDVKMNIVPAPKLQNGPKQDESRVASSISPKFPLTSSIKTSPIKTTCEKENILPFKDIQRSSINDIINQVLQKSRNLKEQLVIAQLEKNDGIGDIQEEIKANIEKISPDCIQEMDFYASQEPNLADNTVDYLFGKDHVNSVLKKHGLDVSISSNSSSSSIHDESLIEHLFYNREKCYSPVSSDSEAEDIHDDTNKLCKSKSIVDNISNCDKSTAAVNVEQSFILSLNKITALGRVNKCKLVLDELYFDEKLKHGSYFVEYSVPIGDKIECETLISRKIGNKTVTFEHTNVFPLLFDEVIINQWQVKSISFKIFYKEKIEDSPKPLADASIRLLNLLLADEFEIKFSAQMRSIDTDDYLGLVKGVLKLNSGEISEMIIPRNLHTQKPKCK